MSRTYAARSGFLPVLLSVCALISISGCFSGDLQVSNSSNFSGSLTLSRPGSVGAGECVAYTASVNSGWGTNAPTSTETVNLNVNLSFPYRPYSDSWAYVYSDPSCTLRSNSLLLDPKVGASTFYVRVPIPADYYLEVNGPNYYSGASYIVVSPSSSIAFSRVDLLAGARSPRGFADSTGASAQFNFPVGLTTDGSYLYVADYGNNAIRRVNPYTGDTITLIGSPRWRWSNDGIPPQGSISDPVSLAYVSGYLYFTERNNVVRQLNLSTNELKTIAGAPWNWGSADGIGTAASFYMPMGLAYDSARNCLYVADQGNHSIRRIDLATLQVTRIAGLPGTSGTADGPLGTGLLVSPRGLLVSGNLLFIADTDAGSIRQLDLTSYNLTTPSASATGLTRPSAIAFDGVSYFVLEDNGYVSQFSSAWAARTIYAGSSGNFGSLDGAPAAAQFSETVFDMLLLGGRLMISDSRNHTIRQIDATTSTVSTIAGMGGVRSNANGIGTSARFNLIRGIARYGTDFYVSDNRNFSLKRIDGAGMVTSVAAGLSNPQEVVQLGGAIYFTDMGNSSLKKYDPVTTGTTLLLNSISAPAGLASNGTDLFVGSTGTAQIVQVTQAGAIVATYGAGFGAPFNRPLSLAYHAANNSIYVADQGARAIFRLDLSANAISMVMGSAGYGAPEDGVASSVWINNPISIKSDGTYLYFLDAGGGGDDDITNIVRRYDPSTSMVQTIAGSYGTGMDNDGSLGTAYFDRPLSLFAEPGAVYVGNASNIRQIH